MIANFLQVASQVAVLFLLIGVGYIAAKFRFFDRAFSAKLTDFVLYFVSPSIIIVSFQKDFDTQNDIVQHMLMDDSTCTAVVEMLMQVIKCTEAEKDHKTIEKEIMPDILKGNPVKFTSKDGFIEKDDSLDDILNPGEKELAMEKMEQGIQRMSNMQKAGSDIFYAGFRQMKRSVKNLR